ncbi:MAG TPA: hypothetical protein ENF73_00055 [Proteobacteria bacterium]|nr:hypothetical protein [Pseudomonadota bacterium]
MALDIEKANSRYVLRSECRTARESVEREVSSLDERLSKIDSRLWGLVMLAIAQLAGIALLLIRMLAR